MKIEDKITELQQFFERFNEGRTRPIKLEFDFSRRCKNVVAQAFLALPKIVIKRTLLQYTIESCKHSLLHELAHIYQFEITGNSSHNWQFKDILDMLLQDYGSPEIMAANTSNKIAISEYKKDLTS